MVVAAALAALAGGACAQGYVGALLGLTKIDGGACPDGYSCDSSDTGAKVYAGYELAPGLAVEIGYTDFGRATVHDDTLHGDVRTTAYTVLAVLRGEVANNVTAVGRLGWARVKAKISASSGGASGNVSDGNMGLYWGLGVEYAINKSFKITAAADFTKSEFDSESTPVRLIGLGAQYGF